MEIHSPEPEDSQQSVINLPPPSETEKKGSWKKKKKSHFTLYNGQLYNGRGYLVCGYLNQYQRPCSRIGKCPFHHDKEPQSPSKLINNEYVTQTDKEVKKKAYKKGWSKDEHFRFLTGLQIHGKGAWKEIAQIVKTRTPVQIQSHSQKYFQRQKQGKKTKKSIHDFTLEDLKGMSNEEMLQKSSIEDGFKPNPFAHNSTNPPVNLTNYVQYFQQSLVDSPPDEENENGRDSNNSDRNSREENPKDLRSLARTLKTTNSGRNQNPFLPPLPRMGGLPILAPLIGRHGEIIERTHEKKRSLRSSMHVPVPVPVPRLPVPVPMDVPQPHPRINGMFPPILNPMRNNITTDREKYENTHEKRKRNPQQVFDLERESKRRKLE